MDGTNTRGEYFYRLVEVHTLHYNGIENNKFMVLIIFTINQCKIFLIQILISVIMLILFDPFKVMLLINPCCDSNRPFLLCHKERNPATERVK